MALAFRIKDPDEFGILFSAYDEYTSILNSLFGRVLTPDDDYYTAPWCFMPTSEHGGFIVFTCQVPWYHNDTSKRCIVKNVDYDRRENYFESALQIMKNNWYFDEEYDRRSDVPFVGLHDRIIKRFDLDEEDIITFTNDGCHPDKDDISQSLEELAVIETCSAMGWQIPLDWREERKQWTKGRCKHQNIRPMVFDLAAYDAAKEKAQSASQLDDEDDSHKRMKYTLPPLSTQGKDGNQYDTKKNDSKQYDPAKYQPQMPSLPSVSNDQSWEGGEEKKEEEEHTPSAAVADQLDNTCVISHLNVFYSSGDNNEEEGPKPYYC